jgi:hypothetical protein
LSALSPFAFLNFFRDRKVPTCPWVIAEQSLCQKGFVNDLLKKNGIGAFSTTQTGPFYREKCGFTAIIVGFYNFVFRPIFTVSLRWKGVFRGRN